MTTSTADEMVFTQQQRREIAGRARTLHERLEGPPNDPGPDPEISPNTILDEWEGLFADEEQFSERLAADGIRRADVEAQSAATKWPSDEPLPAWLETIEELIEYLRASDPTRYASAPDDVPFRELLTGFSEFARSRLGTLSVPDDSLEPLVEGLTRRFHALCVRPLYVEFKSFVEHFDPELAATDPDEFDDPPTEYYEEFIDAMFAHGMSNLCVEYPVLARQIAVIIDNWVDAIAELCQRIRDDTPALEERFDIDGPVTSLEPLSTDAHAKGRIPVRVSFGSTDVIYKPRGVDGGVALYEVLERVSERTSVATFQSPEYLPRDGYGWMEPIAYDDLADTDAVRRYYEQAGVLTCVAYALNMTDCQYENLLIDGESPMVVDGETIFHPYVDPAAMPTPTEVSTVAHSTILATLLAPWSVGDPRTPSDDDAGVPHAGFGSSSERGFKDVSKPGIEAANTDVMTVTEVRPEVNLTTNTASTEERDHPPVSYTESLVEGFTEAYDTIRSLHEAGAFFGEVLPSSLVDGIENRLVYRATARYGSILRSAAARDPLRDGARLSVEHEKLAVPFFDDRIDADGYWPLYAAERRALRRRDFPRFASSPTSSTVVHDGEELPVDVDVPGLDRCRQRVAAMSDDDRDRQAWLLQYAFGPQVPGSTPDAAVSADAFDSTARTLFEEVLDAGIETPDGDAWVSISPTKTGIDLYPTDFSLYHGRGGIALAAAALFETTGETRYRTVAEEVLSPVLDAIDDGGPPPNLGGMLGVGSVVYTLTVVSELLDADEYRRAARSAAGVVTESHVANDETFDVLEGAAGTLLGLLAYHDRYGDESVLDRAIACGERLLDGRTLEDGYRVWRTSDDEPPLTGFSHGACGIGYALARLADATGDERFSDAAREALAFESALYDPDRNNWAKSNEDQSYDDKWCHGRSGMALARLGIADALDDGDLHDTAIDALSETARAEPSNMDHLCCGNFGRVESLLAGARRGLLAESHATELARRCLTRRDAHGEFSMTGHTETFPNPMFFHGLSGVVYSLLRLENPDRLPSVLLLE
ncbi:type 2 lantipeptide synthetase LanM [Haloferax sp. Atlit-12N]|uniref:type 2 lanthipeptide synthetase LanM family protein n=1 Tax=Haloferax sp. Atlit-12N TaxID=2077203 RepID=UPI000E271D84|nr:type 2 lanthipeptide synthetase LanM family protein [Haloferax sp. Atlit-12N]RDZ61944.1 type 2 lantipeptide synthetase LanM [Haloferax sp. Atlit-12N]